MKAVVLRKRPYSETDLIIDFYVEGFGWCTGFASGALRSKKRFPHQFHIAGIYDLNWKANELEGRLYRIQSCELLHFYSEVGQDLEKLAYWSMIQEWVLQNEMIQLEFKDLQILLDELRGDFASEAFHHFLIQQMKVNGWAPHHEQCSSCHREMDDHIRFSIFQGGLIHTACGPGIDLSPEAFQFLRLCIDQDHFTEIKDRISPHLSRELDMVSIPFLEHHIGKHLKSFEFFKSVRGASRSSKLPFHQPEVPVETSL